MTESQIAEIREEFNSWWDKTINGGEWATLERLAAHDAWNAALDRLNAESKSIMIAKSGSCGCTSCPMYTSIPIESKLQEPIEDARELVHSWWIKWMDSTGPDLVYEVCVKKLSERITARDERIRAEIAALKAQRDELLILLRWAMTYVEADHDRGGSIPSEGAMADRARAILMSVTMKVQSWERNRSN
jgi:hypothetical protein